jgi:hypothetical protein
MSTEWKKPQALVSSRFEDIAQLVGFSGHYAEFETLLRGNTYLMNLREFDKIVRAGKFQNGRIKGTLFLNPSHLLRLFE